MAAVGAVVSVSWLLSSGLVGFFILLLLLSVFLTALCSDCTRRSFELQDGAVDRNPSTLIKVVKLEEARENPMISEIQNDEKEFHPHEEHPVSFTPWRSHLGAPQTTTESHPEEEASATFPAWRSHLTAPLSQDLNASVPQEHIYHTIGGGRSSNGDASSPLDNHKAPQQNGDSSSGGQHDAPSAAMDLSDRDRNSVYARVSKKLRTSTSPGQTPEEVKEEEEPSPPLPDRTEMEG